MKSLLQELSRWWSAPAGRPARLEVETLECRTVPYAVTGNAWANPELVTLSFQPDGTNLGGPASNLYSALNARFGSTSAWQTPMLRAAQSWAQYADLNFTVVADSGAGSGTGGYQQGDPSFGDIRVGGFNYNNGSALAMAYLPPPVNNYSIAGDVSFNTGQVWNVNGAAYDIYTVALHEFGHALGLGHSGSGSAVMYPYYSGTDYGLSQDDINGIRAIYGARQQDAYDAAGNNSGFGNASNLDAAVNPATGTAVVTGLDITATSDVDMYRVTALAGGPGTLTVSVQSTGLSLLAPSVRLYDGNQNLLATATGSGYTGSTLTRTINVTPGQSYYVRVAGANGTAFGTGAYALTLNMGSGPAPVVPLPNTTTPNGNPLNGGGGMADRIDANGRSVEKIFNRNRPPREEFDFVEVMTLPHGRHHEHAHGEQSGPGEAAPTDAPVARPAWAPGWSAEDLRAVAALWVAAVRDEHDSDDTREADGVAGLDAVWMPEAGGVDPWAWLDRGAESPAEPVVDPLL